MSFFFNKVSVLFYNVPIRLKNGKRLECKDILRVHHDFKLNISSDSKALFGKRINFFRGVNISVVAGGKIVIGDNCTLNRNTYIMSRGTIKIGNNCLLGPRVTIYDHDHKFGYDGIVKNEYKVGTVEIEEGCWLGANVTVLRDTHIGHHSVVGAGCVVKGDIPPHSLVTADRQLNIVPIEKR